MTTFLALWGAVLATLLAILEGARFFLDRPRLRVSPRVNVSIDGAAIMVEVVNRGRRPTTVTEAGFEPQGFHSITAPNGTEVPVRRWIKLDGPPTVLAPGEMATYAKDLGREGFPSLVPVDFPLRAYAKDLNGKLVWGAAAPLLRMVVQSGWKSPIPPDGVLVEPLPGAPLKPTPVYARWKVWHRLNVRDPLPLERRLRRVSQRPWERKT